ncbi:carboxylate--amine ligase [Cohnella yongneupensis]|uniref:Carboxylate--amine ligase n=1 Tax=Cohnella yongneupensis TaxID=425006 RepID=A0ABW0QXL2_9BACL
MQPKTVILGSNFYTGLSIIRGLGAHGVHTVAMDYSYKNTYGARSRYLREHHIVPHYREHPEQLLQALIAYAKEQSTKPVLYPSVDPYVIFVDRYLDELRQYYLIPMTEQGLWSDIMDKGRLYELAARHGVLVPNSIHPDEERFEERVVADIGFPCIVKPTDSPAFVSKFREKNFLCLNIEDVRAAVGKAVDAKLNVIVQRVITGFDDQVYTFDAHLNQSSKVTHWMTCQKLRQFPIRFGASTFSKQKHIPELFDIGAPFLEAIGYKGFADIEFKKDATSGRFYMIEINARTTTLDPLFRKCGLNFPLILYRELTGQDIGTGYVQKDTGIAICFLIQDLIASRDYRRAKQLNVRQIVSSYFTRKAPAVWSFKDPMPGLHFSAIMAKKIIKRLLRA